MLRAADQVVFISETTAAHFGGLRYRRPPLTLFNGVDTDLFRPAAPRRERARRGRRWICGKSGRSLCSLGGSSRRRASRCCRRWPRLRPEVDFVLAGAGPIDPRRWGLANVRVIAGLSGERLAGLYRAADLLLLPSVGEGYPLVIQEALASGLPVLCGAESAAADPAAAPFLDGVAVDLSRPEATASAFARRWTRCWPRPLIQARQHLRETVIPGRG